MTKPRKQHAENSVNLDVKSESSEPDQPLFSKKWRPARLRTRQFNLRHMIGATLLVALAAYTYRHLTSLAPHDQEQLTIFLVAVGFLAVLGALMLAAVGWLLRRANRL